MQETLIYKNWITYYEGDRLIIQFDSIPKIEDVPILPYIPKSAQKAILKKPYKLSEGIWIKVIYKTNIPYTFYIPSGYRWNGANIPFGLYNIIGSPSDPKFKVASMVHDFLCENHFVIDNNRYLSTKIFDGLLSEVGVSGIKRFLIFHAVDNYQKFCKWENE